MADDAPQAPGLSLAGIGAGIAAAPRLTEGAPLRRFPDWEHRLARWINQAQRRRWQPGAWDCCMAPCEAVREMTGVDPGARVRGRYTDMPGAAYTVIRLHYDAGIRAFEAAVAAEWTHHGLIGWERVAQARRGDVVCFDQPPPHGVTWGIVDLTGERFVAAGRDGLMWGPVAKCRRAWAVG